MKADGIPIVTIMKYTKLPLEEIERHKVNAVQYFGKFPVGDRVP